MSGFADDELLGQFLIEGRELVDRATEDLLALDRTPDDAARIDSAFRAIHTLKGSVGLFDFPPMGAVLHDAEDVMGALRERRIAPRGAVTAMLGCIGVLDGWIEAVARTGALPGDAADEARRLQAVLRAVPGDGPAGHDAAPATRETPAWLPGLLARLPEDAGAGGTITALRYVPDRGCFFRGDDPLALVRTVPDLAALHIAPRTPWEPPGSFDPFACNIVIELLSRAPLDAVRGCFRFVADQVEIVAAPVGRDAGAAAEIVAGDIAPAASSLRIDAARLDALAGLASELIVAKNGLAVLAAEAVRVAPALGRALAARQAEFDRLIGELHRGVMDARMVSMARLFARLARVVRETAASLGKPVRFASAGAATQADKAVVDGLYEPLMHMLRNAVDHGIEPATRRAAAGKPAEGLVRLEARRQGGQIVVMVGDDGGGIDPAALRAAALRKGLLDAAALDALDDAAALDLMFLPGFSTAAAVSAVSGRGVGLDAVRRAVEAMGGRVSVQSEPGAGTRLRLAVPQALAISTVIIVRCGAERFGVPLDAVAETARIERARIRPLGAGLALALHGRTVPLLRLADLLGVEADGDEGGAPVKVLAVTAGDQTVGLAVDGFAERVEVAIRPADGVLAGIGFLSGTALLADGRVLMVLDLPALIAQASARPPDLIAPDLIAPGLVAPGLVAPGPVAQELIGRRMSGAEQSPYRSEPPWR
jgi:two-component system chemotaxis sensor kinase CheA